MTKHTVFYAGMTADFCIQQDVIGKNNKMNRKRMLWYVHCGMDSGSLLKAVIGTVEVLTLISFGGWLSKGQSCHISYFYMNIGSNFD